MKKLYPVKLVTKKNAHIYTVDTFYSDAIQTAEKGLRVSGVRLYIQPFPFQLEYKNNNGDNWPHFTHTDVAWQNVLSQLSHSKSCGLWPQQTVMEYGHKYCLSDRLYVVMYGHNKF